jgi:hypothetical protein
LHLVSQNLSFFDMVYIKIPISKLAKIHFLHFLQDALASCKALKL